MNYTPELGQAVFGQPWHEYEVPEIWEAALAMLGYEIERVMGNIEQNDYTNPMSNTGYRFECPKFVAYAYSWGDEEQPYNFKWRDIEISWYKYLGRGMSANQELNPNRASEMLDECLKAVRELEND